MEFIISKALSWQIIDGTLYIIDEHTKRMFLLNDVAVFVWNSICNKDSIDTMIKKITSQYTVKEEIVRCDIIELYNDLQTKGLIELKNKEVL
ncbi:PqqD family protein [Clostridium sp. KNHs205]|uniref:PqqD family protein n=1 Tax=Clostridium sp. KNHs205 TaxID=1449050 RepID=UPI00051C45AB|nr:PqqD family protein [Clostridium sp. KNHs205]